MLKRPLLALSLLLLAACGPSEEEAAQIDQEAEAAAAEMANELDQMLGDETFGADEDPLADEPLSDEPLADEPLEVEPAGAGGAVPQGVADEEAVEAATGLTERQ